MAVLGLALPACSKSTSSSSSSSTSAVSTTVTTATAGGTTTSVPGTTMTTAVTPNCTFTQLSVAATSNSGMGHIGVVLAFKNTSAQTCKLTGYPGVAGLNAAGHQAIQAIRTLNGYTGGVPTGQSPPVVTLTTGQSASARIEGTDVPIGNATSCPTYPKLLVTPPNTTQSVTIDMSMVGCSPVQVHPVVPGTSGSIIR